MTTAEVSTPADNPQTDLAPVKWEGMPTRVPGQLIPYGEADVKTIRFIAYAIAGRPDRNALPPGIKNPEQAVMVMLWGAEHGLMPTVALQHVGLINGKPYPSTELCMGMAQHLDPTLRIHFEERSLEEARVRIERLGRDDVLIEWTTKDAKQAGLIVENPDSKELKGAWYKYRRRMLTWRAVREALQLIAPDLLAGLGLPVVEMASDEIPDETESGSWGNQSAIVDAEPAIDRDEVASQLGALLDERGIDDAAAYLRPVIEWGEGENQVDRVVLWLEANPGRDINDLLDDAAQPGTEWDRADAQKRFDD